jgi:hypothetical protein
MAYAAFEGLTYGRDGWLPASHASARRYELLVR